jgi:hypothetical protein
MASVLTDNTVDGDILIIQELCKQLRYSKQKTKFFVDAAKHGVIAVETFLEQAIAKVGGLTRTNKNGRDFTDGSDAKKGTVYTHTHGLNGQVDRNVTRNVTIGNLKNKRGILRVVVADPWTQELFYFKVPHSAYADKKKIDLTFSMEGQPEVIKYRCGNLTLSWKMWNKYRVNTFNELCQ